MKVFSANFKLRDLEFKDIDTLFTALTLALTVLTVLYYRHLVMVVHLFLMLHYKWEIISPTDIIIRHEVKNNSYRSDEDFNMVRDEANLNPAEALPLHLTL